MKQTKITFILSFLVLLFLIPSVSALEPFIITENTTYDITENTVYVTIKENTGKDQNINISHIFTNGIENRNISYKSIGLNQSYQSSVYNWQNVSIGKYTTLNITYWNEASYYDDVTNTSYNVTMNKTNYYDNTGVIMPCDYVLGDKSCIQLQYVLTGYDTKYDYLPIPGLKEKIVIAGLKIEQKQDGIPLPKNSIVQLKYTVKHPIVYGNKISDYVNKYDISVCSATNECSILDPTWWDNSWTYVTHNPISNGYRPYQLSFNISNATGTNNATQIFCNGHCNTNFTDIRFTLDNTTSLPYWIENNETGKVWVNVTSNGTVDMYYGNPSATYSSNIVNTFIAFVGNTSKPLISAWNMNYNTLETGGSNNDASIVGGVTYVGGKHNKGAVKFDGTTGYLTAIDVAAYNFDARDGSISYWVNYSATQGTNSPQLLGQSWNTADWATYFYVANKQISIGRVAINDLPSPVSAVQPNTNLFIIFTRSGTTTTIYVNNTQVVQGATAVWTNAANNITFGTIMYNNAKGFLNGTMSNVRIYNGVLTATERANLFSGYGYVTKDYPGIEIVQSWTSIEPAWTTWGNESVFSVLYETNVSQNVGISDSVSVSKIVASVSYGINISQSLSVSQNIDVSKIVASVSYGINISQSINISDSVLVSKIVAPVSYSIKVNQPIELLQSVSILKTPSPVNYIISVSQIITIDNKIIMISTGTSAISGTIINILGSPISFARVDLTGTFDIADVNGHYEISGLTSGSYPILTRAAGYWNNTQTKEITGNTSLDITLKEALAIPPQDTPGFEGIIMIISIVTIYFIRRRKC